jgi:hypothetical protein
MHGLPLLQRRPEGTVQSVLQIELTAPGHDMGEQVTVEGRILFQQGFQIESPFRRDELIQANLVRSDRRPLLLGVPVIRVRTYVTDTLENHCDTLFTKVAGAEHVRVTV